MVLRTIELFLDHLLLIGVQRSAERPFGERQTERLNLRLTVVGRVVGLGELVDPRSDIGGKFECPFGGRGATFWWLVCGPLDKFF